MANTGTSGHFHIEMASRRSCLKPVIAKKMRIVISRKDASDVEEDADAEQIDDENEGEISTRLTSTQCDWAAEELNENEGGGNEGSEQKDETTKTDNVNSKNENNYDDDDVIDPVVDENHVTIAIQTQLTDEENDINDEQEIFESVSQTGNEHKLVDNVHFHLPETNVEELTRDDVIVLPKNKNPKSVKLFFLQDEGEVLKAGSSSLGTEKLPDLSRTRLVMSPPYRPTPSLSNNNIYNEMTYRVGTTSTYYDSLRGSAIRDKKMPELYDKRRHKSGYSGRPPSPTTRGAGTAEKQHKKPEVVASEKPLKKTLKTPSELSEKRRMNTRLYSASSASKSTTSSRANSAKGRPKTTASRVTNVSSLSNRLLNFLSIDDVPTRYSERRRTTRFSATTSRTEPTTLSRPQSHKTESEIIDIRSESSDQRNKSGIMENENGENNELYDLIFNKELENPNKAVNKGFDVIMDKRVSKVVHPDVKRGLFRYDKSCGKPVIFADGSDFFQRMQATLRLQILIGEKSPTRERLIKKINAFHEKTQKDSSRSSTCLSESTSLVSAR